MRDYLHHLTEARGSHQKARRGYLRERGWRDDAPWYAAWERGLADEVERAARRWRNLCASTRS